MNMVEPKLHGLRVLVVEDSFLVAKSISDILSDLGCQVVGPFNNSADAVGVVDAGGCDAAVLDVNLGGETSEPVADDLSTRGLPFLFVTSYTSPALLAPKYAAWPRVHKPLSRDALSDALVKSVRNRGLHGSSDAP
ncbi:MAG TPA: response regulator [Phycisphaerales bacterium]|jgi:two-component SAPR family response regulator|nr:response regulator [Phycisphaerales bacterium]